MPSGEQCYYLAEGKAPAGFQRDEKIAKKSKNACYCLPFRTFIRKSSWTAKWLKDFVKEKWSEGGNSNGSDRSNEENVHGIFITSIGSIALNTSLNHPLQNEILLDNGANGHVCNNIGLASSEIETLKSPSFVQSGAGTCQIIGMVT